MNRVLILLALLLSAPTAQAKLQLPLMFSDGAVVQRDRALPVWGWATPGATVEVAFDGRHAKATASGDGAWRVELPAHAAGGPYVLSVRERSGDAVTVSDVLVGDVWLASGQSNMEWPVAQAKDAELEIARANDARIRHFKVPKSWSAQPEARLTDGQWKTASPQTVGQFSAVAYYFARELRAHSDVPIGIIDSTWGGSRIEAWMDADSLGVDAEAMADRMREVRERDERALAEARQRLPGEGDADDTNWRAADLDDRNWSTIQVPALWEAVGYPGMDGVAWYRTTFELSAKEAAAGVALGLGMIDDSDEVWVNGQRVGGMTNRWNAPRQYDVPAQVLKAGTNHVAIRVTDTGGGGGIHGDAALVHVQPRGGTSRPFGTWKFRPAKVTVSMQDDKNQVETLLFNQMIHPLQPYPLRGVIWYQGEANATNELAYRYRDQFASLIGLWRKDWAQPQLPFLWVQLANFRAGGDTGEQSPWAVLRESQSHTLRLPATAQVVTIDIGNPDDIHPTNKQEVGRRLALAARHVAYGESLVFSGPVFHGAKMEGARARVMFDLQGSGLAVRGGGSAIQGFELAGEDRRFHPAKATIEGDFVIVTSDTVKQPSFVRYAWSENPEQANLINREGLPASPFRSDEGQ